MTTTLNGVSNLTLSARSLACPDHVPILTIENCCDITIKNTSFYGLGALTYPNKLYYAMVELRGTNYNIRFLNCRFENGGNHGVAHLYGNRTSFNVTFDDCEFIHGGNYGRTDGLQWDGAAIAVGGKNVVVRNCKFTDWTRCIEFENPYTDCSFSVEGCEFRQCPHAGVWITPTGFQNNIVGQSFTGKVLNCTFEDFMYRPNAPFLPSAINCTGGHDILVQGNKIDGMPNGCGIQFCAVGGPIERVQIIGNSVRNIGRSGILFKPGHEGVKAKADYIVCQGNMLSKITGTPIDIDVVHNAQANNMIVP